MSSLQDSFWKRRWKLVLNVTTFVALLILIYAIRGQLADTIKNFAHVNGWALLLIVPIEALNYHAQAKLYQGMFRIVGNDLSYKYLLRTSLELNFVNHVFPSGGAAGISYFGVRMKNGQISGAKATLIQVMKLGLTFISFEVLLLFGMIALSVMGRVNNVTVLVGTALSMLLIGGSAVFIYIVGSQQRINSFFVTITRWLNWVIHLVRPKSPETINIEKARGMFDDFHANYRQLQRSLPELKMPFWYALLANITEVLAIYVVFIAFGHFVNVGAVILAYGIANFAGLVSVLPGGVGIYEVLMTAVLASAGVPASLSIPVIVMYRVVNTLIQLPPGYVYYQRTLAGNQGQRPDLV